MTLWLALCFACATAIGVAPRLPAACAVPPLGHASLTHSVTCTSPLFWAKLKLRLSPSQPLYDQGTIEEKEKDVEDSQDIFRFVGIAPQTKEYLIASK
jgi:hypothetical protein